MERETLVYVDLQGTSHLVGRLWSHLRRGKESASFEYDKTWLTRGERFSLEPAISLGAGAFHTSPEKPLFGSIGDSAPDRWGRVLMRRAERRRAEQAKESPRSLAEIDYLLLVHDEARQGALRFAENERGPFLTKNSVKIPPLIELPRLLSAADHLASDSESDEDLRLLLAPGSSLGGARPKASIQDHDGSLAVAKFPHQTDETDVVRWESLALALAKKAALRVPSWRVVEAAGKPVLLLRRFDREGAIRVPVMSAMSMVGANDLETRSYLELADALRRYGAAPKEDMHALWRRIVFNILVSNTDDHLRNHGFLYAGGEGWRLAPAYDLNPTPTDVKPRVLTTAIDDQETTASLEVALKVAEYFELGIKKARAIVAEVGRAVATWRSEAGRLGLSKPEIERMASAFEHEDLRAATKERLH